ncbi:MAG TPA: efflux RND transporter periplasmic adaptor subunit [Anaeromyxobacteraceae bacterium]|nr:efflux RND transporter periplasmic adaptor subunit [Anaeromyxobacteraceae bacterium]
MHRTSMNAVLLLACAVALGCRRGEPHAPPPRPVRVQHMAPPASSGELRYSASFQPREQVSLAFKVGGYVRDIAQRPGPDGTPRPLQQGDVVRKGSELARIREADYQQKVAQARAQRAGAAATLARARADADRAGKLYAAESLTRVDHDAAQAALQVAAAQLAAADADLETASLSLADTALRAPMDAVVLSRSVEAGTLASPGTAAFVIADVSRLKAVFGVPERVARSLRVGQALPLELESPRGEPLPGRVTAVAPSADPQSRVFTVEVTVSNPAGQLRAGTIATVRVPSDRGRATPAAGSLPLAAVVRSPARRDGYAVFVVEDAAGHAVARAREVELGQLAGNEVEVAAGLLQQERVVVVGASLLADGERVSVLE